MSQIVKQLSSWFTNASEQFDSAVMPRERVRICKLMIMLY